MGFEEGGESRVSCTWVGGGLEVSSPEGAVVGVVVRQSEAPSRDFCVEAGQVGGVELGHIRADEGVWVA